MGTRYELDHPTQTKIDNTWIHFNINLFFEKKKESRASSSSWAPRVHQMELQTTAALVDGPYALGKCMVD